MFSDPETPEHGVEEDAKRETEAEAQRKGEWNGH